VKRLRRLLESIRAATPAARRPVGIQVGYTDADGTRRHRSGEALAAEELATCRLWIDFGDEGEENAAMIADGRIEMRTERVEPGDGYSALKEPPLVN
jgi:hypothetical protein